MKSNVDIYESCILLGFTVHHADCPVGHDSASLCCKSGVDFDNFYRAIEAGQKYG